MPFGWLSSTSSPIGSKPTWQAASLLVGALSTGVSCMGLSKGVDGSCATTAVVSCVGLREGVDGSCATTAVVSCVGLREGVDGSSATTVVVSCVGLREGVDGSCATSIVIGVWLGTWIRGIPSIWISVMSQISYCGDSPNSSSFLSLSPELRLGRGSSSSSPSPRLPGTGW